MVVWGSQLIWPVRLKSLGIVMFCQDSSGLETSILAANRQSVAKATVNLPGPRTPNANAHRSATMTSQAKTEEGPWNQETKEKFQK